MDYAPHTDDLDLSTVTTREDLVAMLRTVHVRSDKPSLRTLEARTRHSALPLSKTVAAELLKGVRFPRKGVMISFVRACGIPDEAMEPWRRAWERVAAEEAALDRHGVKRGVVGGPRSGTLAGQQASSAIRDITVSDPQASDAPGGEASGTPANVEEAEIRLLRDRAGQLAADNERLRLQLAWKPDIPSLQVSPVRDLTATVFMGSQDQAVRYFAMDDSKSERLFYSDLAKYIQNAKEAVYLIGKGFHQERSSSVYRLLIRAERDALRHGVDMIRIQTGNPVAVSWAKGYAQLLADYPGNFRMIADLDGIFYNDVLLIDPRGRNPIVIFLFETREPAPLGSVGRPIVALFIMNARTLASNLADQLVNHADELMKLTPQAVRDLASKYIYFSWGVHMSSRKMRRDVPDARPLGRAIIRKWSRHINGMLSGPADRATIEYTGGSEDAFDGVAYELSWWGKARLDRLERRAYGEESVDIELNGQVRRAFTYVPLPAITEKTAMARGSWMDSVIEGAVENDMAGLIAELRDGGVRMDSQRP